jgi:hypothetical protein
MAEHPFVGTWRLVSVESRTADGRVRYPYGRDAQGYLVYSAEGYMCVAIMAAQRQHFAAANDASEGTPEELAAAGKLYVSYAGPYSIQAGGIIRHQVEVSFFPNWIGGTQERLYAFKGNRLTLSTRPLMIRGQARSSHLIWERVS